MAAVNLIIRASECPTPPPPPPPDKVKVRTGKEVFHDNDNFGLNIILTHVSWIFATHF